MSLIPYLFGVGVALVMLTVIIVMLLRRSLRERHALWWLVIGILALIAALFPPVLDGTARFFGISLPITLVMFLGIFVLFLVSVQHSSELTKLEEQTRILAEQHALLEAKVARLSGPEAGTHSSQTEA